MTTAYTTLLGLALPVTGELAGTWGTVVNTSITQLVEDGLAGTTTLSSDADVTLTTTQGSSNQARSAVILWTASGTVTRNITAPAASKAYIVINATGSTQSIVIRGVGPTTGVTVAAGTKTLVAWNGSDFVSITGSSVAASDITGVLGVDHGGTGAASFTANRVLLGNGTSAFQTVAPGTSGNVLTSNGTTWASATPSTGGTVTNVGFSGGTTGLGATGSPINTTGTITLNGTLVVANGGTGSASLTANNVLLGNGTAAVQTVAPGSSGNILTSNGTTWASAAPGFGGTVTSVALSGGTTGLTMTGSPVTSVGTITIAGTLALANGGTGQTTAQASMNSLAAATTSGYYLRGNGTNVVMAALAAADITGTISITQGGTGAATYTANNVLLGNGTSAFQTVAPGTSGNVLKSNGTTWTSGALVLTDLTGTLGVDHGGTGAATYTADSVLLGNGTSAFQTVNPSTAGNVLTSNGTTWVSKASNAGVLLLSTTISGTPTSVTFSSTYLTATYDDYLIVISGVQWGATTSTEPYMNFDGGFNLNYSLSSTVSGTTTNTSGASVDKIPLIGTASLETTYINGTIYLYGINSGLGTHTGHSTMVSVGASSAAILNDCAFTQISGSAITSVTIFGQGMNYGHISLYGIPKL